MVSMAKKDNSIRAHADIKLSIGLCMNRHEIQIGDTDQKVHLKLKKHLQLSQNFLPKNNMRHSIEQKLSVTFN